MTYLTIDEINASTDFAPIGDEINFNRRIVVDELKNKLNPKTPAIEFKNYLYTTFFQSYKTNKRYQDWYEKNFYHQFTMNYLSWRKGNYGTIDGGNKNTDPINLKDYKRFFKEMGFEIPKGAKKEYFSKTFREYLSH